MGVSGTGKSTLGRALADHLGGSFLEADDFHPQANIQKMSSGKALTDADRAPWLRNLAAELERRSQVAGSITVLACSALKERYRDALRVPGARTDVVFLDGPREVIRERLSSRKHHFMPATLLDSQLEALEVPHRALHADIIQPVDELVDELVPRLL